MPRIERDRELARRRQRRAKLRKLEAKFAKASPGEKEVIVAKVRKIAPLIDLDERAAERKKAAKKA